MTPNEIRTKQFDRKRGAYRVEEVSDYLIEVAEYVERILEDKNDLEAKLTVLAEKLEEYRADEESLRAALIGAQKLGDSVVRDSKEKAEQLLREASQRAEQMISDAQSTIDREAIELTRMQSQVASFKDQVMEMYRRQIESIMVITEEYNLPNVEAPAATPPSPPPVQAPMVAEMQPQQRQPDPITFAAPDEQQYAAPTFEIGPDHSPDVAPAAADVTFKRAEMVDSFVLSYDELEELPEDPQEAGPSATESEMPSAESPVQHRKRSNFGDLRFGEEYNLTRKS